MERDKRMGLANYYGKDQLDARRYMPGLDGLRALAVLAVIAYHVNMPWAGGGLLGVCIFFVLSGYLITDILVAQYKSSGGIDLKEFWLGRARPSQNSFRSMPPEDLYWATRISVIR